MPECKILFLPDNITVTVPAGTSLLQAQIQAGIHPDAPCGGQGTCGKCRVTVEGREVLACQTLAEGDLAVYTRKHETAQILSDGQTAQTVPDGDAAYVIALDIGTTTVVAYLMEGKTGRVLAQSGMLNPQSQFGADVISRIQHVLDGGGEEMQSCIRSALADLTREVCAKAGIAPEEVGTAAIVGNTAMHHLLLGIDPHPLVIPPYMPNVYDAMELDAEGLLPISGKVRILPNIAGFVGGDTVGCMTSVRFDQLEELTLLVDIGTNGEMVLGDKHRRIACSTAAGPAFEGAKISCGMRGADGAVDHVYYRDGEIIHHVLGGGEAVGLCGSGLLDLIAVLLDAGILDESGCLEEREYRLTENVTLTQKDVREVQLAKAAIRAGVELLAQNLGVQVEDIQQVLLAGAFGNYMTPASACRIGMIPPVLEGRIKTIGNAAGAGAKLCALSKQEFAYSKALAKGTEFLELASLPQFQDQYVDALEFEEEDQ